MSWLRMPAGQQMNHVIKDLGLWARQPLGRGGGLELEFKHMANDSISSFCNKTPVRQLVRVSSPYAQAVGSIPS